MLMKYAGDVISPVDMTLNGAKTKKHCERNRFRASSFKYANANLDNP